MKVNWRVIELEKRHAAMNMAIDHAISKSVATFQAEPTIRFYKWTKNSISLGAHQKIDDINIAECKKHGIEIVRRMTGGRAVFHSNFDFTYSVIAPLQVLGKNLEDAYARTCACIIDALKNLGINSSLQNKNDIMVGVKKISGNSAKIMDNEVYLQHGTLVYDIDFYLMPKCLNIPKNLAKEKITSVMDYANLGETEVYRALFIGFTSGKNFQFSGISEQESKRANELAQTIYKDPSLPFGDYAKSKGACYVSIGGG